MREDWLAEAEFARTSVVLLRTWVQRDQAMRDAAPWDAAVKLCGKWWDSTLPDTRDDILVVQLLRHEYGKQFAGQMATGYCRAFERELRYALVRAGFAPADVSVDVARLFAMAEGMTELADVVSLARNKGFEKLRNKAAHGQPFADTDFRRVEALLFGVLRDGSGILGSVVVAHRTASAADE